MTPLASVIIVNWNGLFCLPDCLAGLQLQTFRDFEVIIVDNGSTDGSLEWMQENHPRIRVVPLPTNEGFAGGNQAGLAKASGRFFVLLNNDTAPEPNWLADLVRTAGERPRVGIVASHLTDWAGRVTDSAGDGLRPTGRGYQRHRGLPANMAPIAGPVFSACAGAALYKRELIDEIGFLDERFFMNGEDTDLSFRARLAGWEVWFCPDARVRHRVSASQGHASARSVYFNHRNHLWSYTKCMPGSLVFKYLWLLAIELPARWFKYALQGRGWACFTGIVAGILGAPRFWAERQTIQRERRATPDDIEHFFVAPKVFRNLGWKPKVEL